MGTESEIVAGMAARLEPLIEALEMTDRDIRGERDMGDNHSNIIPFPLRNTRRRPPSPARDLSAIRDELAVLFARVAILLARMIDQPPE